MPRSLVVVALVATGLLDGRAARAADPCAEDVKQFCAQVQPGGGRVQSCLRQNEAKISAACSAKLAADESRIRSRLEEFVLACRGDAGRLCGEVKPGGGRVIACLFRNQDHLSSSCLAEMERIEGARENVQAVREACRADLERVCSGVPPEAGALVECLQEHRADLSEACRSVDPGMVTAAAQLIDAVEALTSKERAQEALQILQGLESIAFSRSQILFQIDSYQELGGIGNANRLLFNPQLVFGSRNQFAFQLKVPVIGFYPAPTGMAAQTGLGDITTAFAWGVPGSGRVRQYLSLALQWKTAAQPVGGTWAVTPAYAIAVGLKRWLSVTGQVAWIRSFAGEARAELNLLMLEPILVLNLPGRSFFALDTRLGWNLSDGSFVPLMKGVAGIFIDRQKSLSISAWYQHSLTDSDAAVAQSFKWAVGTGLAYFFDW